VLQKDLDAIYLNNFIEYTIDSFLLWKFNLCNMVKASICGDADYVVTMLARIEELIYIISFITSFISTYYSGDEYEAYAIVNRATGRYWWAFWMVLLDPLVSTQLMWVKKFRTNRYFRLAIGLVLLIGVSFE